MVRKRILRRGLLWPWRSSKSLHTSPQQAVFGKAQVRLGPREKKYGPWASFKVTSLTFSEFKKCWTEGKENKVQKLYLNWFLYIK